jgi:isopentenyl phosphate kinase
MSELVFCKLGGSVITEKARPETARPDVIARLAGEVSRSLARRPDLRLVLGHGSGSFGHVAAHRFRTRQGVYSAADWHGFVQVAAAAARLNRIVSEAFLAAGVPVWSVQPSASARCRGGELVSLALEPVVEALAHGLVPLVYGDVGLDELQGGTIISTEQVLATLARELGPARLVLMTSVDGVFDRDPWREPARGARPIPEVSAANWAEVRAMLSGSHTTDVTGGMLSKVEEMVALVQELPGLTVHIVSGERAGALEAALSEPTLANGGTVIRW